MLVPEAERGKTSSLKIAALCLGRRQAVIRDHRVTPSGHLGRRAQPLTPAAGALRWARGAQGARRREDVDPSPGADTSWTTSEAPPRPRPGHPRPTAPGPPSLRNGMRSQEGQASLLRARGL